MIYTYDIKVPLIYNHFDINSKSADSELRFNLEKSIELKTETRCTTQFSENCSDKWIFNDTTAIKIYCTYNEDKQKFSEPVPDPFITCEITNLLAADEKSALQEIECILDKLSKELSFIFNRQNHNRHLYQPRVEPDWMKFKIKSQEYEPYVKKYSELKKSDTELIFFKDTMRIRDSVHITGTLHISPNEIQTENFFRKNTPEFDFIFNEYYLALGTENMKSKFFHLFVIIEFCEREYKQHNKSTALLSEDEIKELMTIFKNHTVFQNKENLLSRINGTLTEATDIGRAQKLLNILEWMGIKSYRRFGEEKSVNKKLLQNLIDLRNKTFHSGLTTVSNDISQYGESVEVLFYIDEMIIDFMRNKH